MLNIFKQGNWKDAKRLCPICNSGKDGEVILIPIYDKIEGFNAEAIQVHLEYLDLFFNETTGIIYQTTKEKKQ
jgi:hypothetical protein